MILQILPDSWILRVACNTVDPYTLPASHHIFFRINGIIKCDRNIKYSRAALGSNFEIRVVSDGPFSATSAGNGTPAQQHSYFELLPSARYERRVGVSLVRAAWERRPEGPAYLLSSVTLLYLAGLCAF